MAFNKPLIDSIVKDDIQKLKELVEEKDALVDVDDALVLEAVEQNSINVLKYLHEKGIDIRFEKESSLVLASGFGHIEMVRFLIGIGADMYADNSRAITSALLNARINVVKLFIENGLDVDKIDLSTNTKVKKWVTEYKKRKNFNEELSAKLNKNNDSKIIKSKI